MHNLCPSAYLTNAQYWNKNSKNSGPPLHSFSFYIPLWFQRDQLSIHLSCFAGILVYISPIPWTLSWVRPSYDLVNFGSGRSIPASKYRKPRWNLAVNTDDWHHSEDSLLSVSRQTWHHCNWLKTNPCPWCNFVIQVEPPPKNWVQNCHLESIWSS